MSGFDTVSLVDKHGNRGAAPILWVDTVADPAATGNTGTLPRFEKNSANGFIWYVDSTGRAEYVKGTTYIKVVQATATVVALGTTSATGNDYLSINIPRAGSWIVSYAVRAFNNAAARGLASYLTDAANVEFANTKLISIFSSAAVNVQTTAFGRHLITTTGAQTIKLRIHSIGASAGAGALSDTANGLSWISVESV